MPAPAESPALAPLEEGSPIPRIIKALAGAQRVYVATHKNPDGDCLGSTIAMVLALRSLGKEAVGHTPGPLLVHFHDIPGIAELAPAFPRDGGFDLTLALDCGSLERLGDDFKPFGPVINIDHHKSNDRYGDINWVDPEAAATGEMVYDLLCAMQAPITPPIAGALFLAIATDTGSFRFPNTRPRTFAIAGDLVMKGADPAEAGRVYWDNATPESVRLRAEALRSIRIEAGGRIAWSQLTAAQYAANGGMEHEPEGLSTAMRGIRGVEVGCLFTEVQGKGVRVSLRSHGNLDVAEVAHRLGGGGHHAAAGIFLEATLEEARDRVLGALREAVASPGGSGGRRP